MNNLYWVSVFFDVPILAETELAAEMAAKEHAVNVPDKALFSAYKTLNQSAASKKTAVNYDGDQ